MVVYPGDPDVMLERVSSIADGDLANVSRLDFGVHTGTHVDAPVHFVDGAPGAESLPLAALVGEAVVHGTEGCDRCGGRRRGRGGRGAGGLPGPGPGASGARRARRRPRSP